VELSDSAPIPAAGQLPPSAGTARHVYYVYALPAVTSASNRVSTDATFRAWLLTITPARRQDRPLYLYNAPRSPPWARRHFHAHLAGPGDPDRTFAASAYTFMNPQGAATLCDAAAPPAVQPRRRPITPVTGPLRPRATAPPWHGDCFTGRGYVNLPRLTHQPPLDLPARGTTSTRTTRSST